MSRRIYRKQDTKSDGILYDPVVIRLVDPVSAAAFDGRGSLSSACSGRSGRWSSEQVKSWCPGSRQPGPLFRQAFLCCIPRGFWGLQGMTAISRPCPRERDRGASYVCY
jgi:hypothetical protein